MLYEYQYIYFLSNALSLSPNKQHESHGLCYCSAKHSLYWDWRPVSRHVESYNNISI